MKELRTYINEGILGNLDDIMGGVDTEVQKNTIMEFLRDIGANRDPNNSVELKYNQDTGKYTVEVTQPGKMNVFNKLDLGYKIPELIECIDYTKNISYLPIGIECSAKSDEIDCSFLDILKLMPDSKIAIRLPDSTKKINVHNLNIKGRHIDISPSVDTWQDCDGKSWMINFCNDCDLSGVTCLRFLYMNLSDLSDLRGFKGEIIAGQCTANENTDFRIRKSCLKRQIDGDFEFNKSGVLKCNADKLDLKYNNLTNKYGITGIVANRITNLNIDDLPLIKSAKEVFAAGFNGDINLVAPKDVGIEYMVVSWPQDNHGRMLNGFVKKVNKLKVFTKKLVLNLRLSYTDMKSIQSSCEELQILIGNPVCASIANTVNKNPNSATIRWYDEKNFPNLKKIYYTDNRTYLDCCIEKVEGRPNLWKLVYSN